MIDQFVALCFRKRLVVRLIAIFACIFGIYSWTQLAIDAYPLLSPVSVQVTTQVPGLAAEEIEQQITIPLERALNGTPGGGSGFRMAIPWTPPVSGSSG